jgi:hypothetical protein
VGSELGGPGVSVGDKGAGSCEEPSVQERWADQGCAVVLCTPIYVGQMADMEWPGVDRGGS